MSELANVTEQDQQTGNEKKDTLTLQDLSNIQRVLRFGILPVPDTGLNYIINKNLHKLDKYLKGKDQEAKSLRDTHTIKDKDGNPIRYAYYADVYDTKNPLYNQCKLDEKGNFIIVPEDDIKNTPFTSRIDFANPQYIKDMELLDKDVEFTFYKFPQADIEKMIKTGKFDKIDWTVLIGYLFDDF